MRPVRFPPLSSKAVETGVWVTAMQAWCQQGDGVPKWCAATSGLAHQGSLPGGGGIWAGPGRIKGNTAFLKRSPQLFKVTEQTVEGDRKT